MKRWCCLLLFAAACGHRVTDQEAELLKASVGVAANELASSIKPERLKAIAADLAAADPAIQRLGQEECILLQTRAVTLGREVAAQLPLVLEQTARTDKVSGELQGALHCGTGAPFDPTELQTLLGEDVREIEAMIQPRGPKTKAH
jgi:hypothetical protein